MASMSTVRLTKGDSPNWGFRLQGGKDFGTPLVIQKVSTWLAACLVSVQPDWLDSGPSQERTNTFKNSERKNEANKFVYGRTWTKANTSGLRRND